MNGTPEELAEKALRGCAWDALAHPTGRRRAAERVVAALREAGVLTPEDEYERIASDLSTASPWGNERRCKFCDAAGHAATSTLDPTNHAEHCVWLRARVAVEAHIRPDPMPLVECARCEQVTRADEDGACGLCGAVAVYDFWKSPDE